MMARPASDVTCDITVRKQLKDDEQRERYDHE